MAEETEQIQAPATGDPNDPAGLRKKLTGPIKRGTGQDPLGLRRQLDAKLKKKEPAGASSSPAIEQSSQSSSPLGSTSLHDSIFSEPPAYQKIPSVETYRVAQKKKAQEEASKDALDTKAKIKEFENTGTAEAVADEKTSMLNRTLKEEKRSGFRSRFFDGALTAQDIEDIHDNKMDLVSAGNIATAINNKTKNLKAISDAALQRGAKGYLEQLKHIDDQLNALQKPAQTDEMIGPGAAMEPTMEKVDPSVIRGLEQQKTFLKRSLQSVYEAKAKDATRDILNDMHAKLFKGKDWSEISKTGAENKIELIPGLTVTASLKFDPKTHTLTEQSEKLVRDYVDSYLNKNPDDIINVSTTGDVDRKKRNYADISDRVINHINTVLPVQEANKNYTQSFISKHPDAKGLIEHRDAIFNSLTPEKVAEAEAYIRAKQDKKFLNIKEKYWGTKTGIATTNPETVKIRKELERRVQAGELTEEQANDQMKQQIKHNPQLKQLLDNEQKEYDNAMSEAKDLYAQKLTEAISKVDPGTVMFKDGSIGIKGMTQTESKSLLDEYEKGLMESTGKVLSDQQKAIKSEAETRAKRQGAFFGSLTESITGMQKAFANYFFHMTGFGGDDLRWFQSAQHAKTPISQTEEAKKWNFKGVSSLLDPKFYMSTAGKTIPIFAGAAAVGALTEGADMPAYIGWLANAGLYDAQMGIQTFDDLESNGVDKFGNKLTTMDAANAAHTQMMEQYIPDLLFMAASGGILGRAKAISKPTLAKSIAGVGVGAVVGAVPMTWQGYLSYANQLKAEGKTPDIWDYAQDPMFSQSLIDGIVGGSMIGLAHLPGQHAKRVENWRNLIFHSAGEFHANSLYNIALQDEISGLGEKSRDAMKIQLATENMDPKEKEALEDKLLYSNYLARNIKAGKIDIQNINGAYQAHMLAMADMFTSYAYRNAETNKSLSNLYTEKAKEYKGFAKDAMDGKGKFMYVTDKSGMPIFISEHSFKVMDADGFIKGSLKSGELSGVFKSDDPEFNRTYMEEMKKKEEVKAAPVRTPDVGTDNTTTIINALKKNQHQLTGLIKAGFDANADKPEMYEAIANEIISQAIDHPKLTKDMVGEEAWKVIEPIVQKERESIKQKEELKKKSEEEIAAKKAELEQQKAREVISAGKPEFELNLIEDKDLEGKQITLPASIKETGEKKMVKVNAKEMHQQIKDQLSVLKQIANCLG